MGSHVLKAFFYLDVKPLRQIKQGGKVMKKTIVIGNSIIVYTVDNGADCGVCGGYFG